MRRVRVRDAVFSLAMGAGVVVAASCYGALNLDGIEAIWLFDEGDGDVLSDASGNEHDADFVGEPEWVDGVYGGAVSFDGQEDYAEVVDWSTPELNDFTLGCWVMPGEDQKSNATILDTHQTRTGLRVASASSRAAWP